MPEIVNIYDGGLQKIRGGKVVGVIHFDITTNEGRPERLTGYCQPNYRESIIKSLKRVIWRVPVVDPETSQED